MKLQTARYSDQLQEWPTKGCHILANFDSESVIVYQAYRPSIADYAVTNQKFGGEYKFTRMSWIKPNFLWMMYRCGWATKTDQERVLALRIRRSCFDKLLESVVHSRFTPDVFPTREDWQAAVDSSDVRLQWDPDHDPFGTKVERRAIQLGVRGATLQHMATDWLLGIEDVTEFVHEQHAALQAGGTDALVTPLERVYPPPSREIAMRLGLDWREDAEFAAGAAAAAAEQEVTSGQ